MILKTFRLFISSTFSDFQRERSVLQTEVFPRIKEYCRELGFTFQPIDLRWGVSQEAQLDQKTLELCLNEVMTCKLYPDPNFLIMIGDRYGWVPLPYFIEKSEFDMLLSFMKPEQKALTLEWYAEDLNQIPISYILKERTGEFELHEEWSRVENLLRSSFHKAIELCGFEDNQKDKYFISATEAEAYKGILRYRENSDLNVDLSYYTNSNANINNHNVFGFFRDIVNRVEDSNKYVSDDFEHAQDFKNSVKSILHSENSLSIQTKQINESQLDEFYIPEFAERIYAFLKAKIDEHDDVLKRKSLSSLETELFAQEQYLTQKTINFQGQDLIREKVQSYILGSERSPLVIYGESGIGKSSIMAKCISEIQSVHNVYFRFIGATPLSGNTIDMISSLSEEMGFNFSIQEKNDSNFEFGGLQQNTLHEVARHFHNSIQNSDRNFILFLDALDQLSNDDELQWLPQHLPPNVKIVISALSDTNYPKESSAFKLLQNITTLLYPVSPIEDPLALIKVMLEGHNRTLQNEQEKYFLEQYKNVLTPLYIKVASEEMKLWKSTDLNFLESKEVNSISKFLPTSQKSIFSQYLDNLQLLYHHNKEFVERVCTTVCCSLGGLSETEILKIISVDKELVKELSPVKWHDNKQETIPIVHWTRLLEMLKSFFGVRMNGEQVLYYFFHREISTTVLERKGKDQRLETTIGSLQELITRAQDHEYNKERWGEIYLNFIYNDYLVSGENSLALKSIDFLCQIENMEWLESYYYNIKGLGNRSRDSNNIASAIFFFEYGLELSENILELEKVEELEIFKWMQNYIRSSMELASCFYSIHKIKLSESYFTKSYDISKALLKLIPDIWIKNHLIISSELAFYHTQMNSIELSIEILNKMISLCESKDRSMEELGFEYAHILNLQASNYDVINNYKKALELRSLSLAYMERSVIDNDDQRKVYISTYIDNCKMFSSLFKADEAILYGEKSVTLAETYFIRDRKKWVGIYTKAISALAFAYMSKMDYENAKKSFERSIEIIRPFFVADKKLWALGYITDLNNLAHIFFTNGEFQEANERYDVALNEFDSVSFEENERSISLRITVLMNYGASLAALKKSILAIKYSKDAIKMVEPLYKDEKAIWGEMYAQCLNTMGSSYGSIELYEKSIYFYKESLAIREELYELNPIKFKLNYATALSNFADSILSRDDKKEAIPYMYKALEILKDIPEEDYNMKVLYIKNLHDLGYISFDENSPTVTISLLETGKKELEKLFQNNIIWGEQLIRFIKGLITINEVLDNFDKVYMLKLELRVIQNSLNK